MLESGSNEAEGSGPALVLQHGFAQCIEDWSECGYVAALRPNYRVILIDARGHGPSDNPHVEASYMLDRRADDATSVPDALGIEKEHFWGYSMGGWIGFGLAWYPPHRINSLVIGGQHPFGVTSQRSDNGFVSESPKAETPWSRHSKKWGDQ